jgi:hypothetical protein
MKDELYKKVYIDSDDDLPKKSGVYFVKLNNGNGRILYFPFEGDVGFNVFKSDWIAEVEYYLQPIPDQDLPSDEDIEEWIKAEPDFKPAAGRRLNKGSSPFKMMGLTGATAAGGLTLGTIIQNKRKKK